MDYDAYTAATGGFLTSGTTTTIQFLLQQFDDEEQVFRVNAVDELGFVTSITPSIVTVGPSETVTIDVQVQPSLCDSLEPILDSVLVSATTSSGDSANSASLTLYTVCNQPPSCGEPTTKSFWPPNGRMETIDILEQADVSDPDGDDLDIVITRIEQDEPVQGNGKKRGEGPDASGVGTGIASIRVERDGQGDGRVYVITFEANDGKGATCEGTLFAHVPKSQSGSPAVRGDNMFDSTQVAEPGKGRRYLRGYRPPIRKCLGRVSVITRLDLSMSANVSCHSRNFAKHYDQKTLYEW